MKPERTLHPATLAAQALGHVDPATRALVPGIHPSTTYLREPDGSYPSGRVYSRTENPSYEPAEDLIAELEGGAGCLLFGSGMAAATAAFQSLAPGDHVVSQDVMYWGVRKWLTQFAVPWGLDVDLIPAGDLTALEAALRPGRTKLVWIETPANPTWAITDIAAAAGLAHAAGARLAVDSTAATPVLTRPLALGADLVMHSATKYLNGHTDVVAGALVTAQPDEMWERLRALRHDAGPVLGPFEAWLLLRGIRTLVLRVEACCRGAAAVAQRFHGHPRVREVLYPGLPSHPGHAVAARQMRGGFGGMLSLCIAGGEKAAIDVAARVRVFKRATSLGGVESLIEHRASVEPPESKVPRDLLRISIGIEHPDDLIADLEQAIGL
ncbi:MAG TPA: aminotransferase class V-fold PLP-dependent enzyme [Gemmatimonadota bacterium]